MWRVPDEYVRDDEHWIDSATADGSPWDEDVTFEEDMSEPPEPS